MSSALSEPQEELEKNDRTFITKQNKRASLQSQTECYKK